jgi:1-phosphofructokinase family hexose kinase
MILCLGTTPTVQRTMIFQRLTLNAVNRAMEVRQTASGKSLNVARTLHTLGRDPLACGFLGGDTGKFMRQDLDGCGIAHDFVSVAPPTRTCTTVIDRAAATATELIEEPAPLGEADYVALLSNLRRHLPRAQALVLSGSLPPGAPQDFYADCVRAAAAVTVILDATGAPLAQALAARPTVVKPNRAELAQTMGIRIETPQQLHDAMRRLAGQGPTWVVVTLGADGVAACDGKSIWQIAAPPVSAVSTIGCGDAFAAGLAAALCDGRSVPEACVLGAACGGANALNIPAGHARREDIERLRKVVSSSSIS